MENLVTKTFNGKKFQYFFNGDLYRNSSRDYKYACVATPRLAKGATREGGPVVISLGNKIKSTYDSYARFYDHCDLEVVEIQPAK